MLHLSETIDLIDNGSIEHSYYNILNSFENYEWDIIHIFKNYDFYITNKPDKIYPPCKCPFCIYCTEDEKMNNIKILRTVIYIKEFIDTICDFLIVHKTIPFIKSDQGKIILNRIEDYYDYLDEKGFIKITIWPEKEKCFEKIFGMPRIFQKSGIDEEFYKMRKNTYFHSEICGNTKASHGWFWESLVDMSDACGDEMNTFLEGFNLSSKDTVSEETF